MAVESLPGRRLDTNAMWVDRTLVLSEVVPVWLQPLLSPADIHLFINSRTGGPRDSTSSGPPDL
jgi:hypothetical protein